MTIFFLLNLFDLNYFESDNSEEKNYKIESFAANQINLHKQLIKSVQKLFLKHLINRTYTLLYIWHIRYLNCFKTNRSLSFYYLKLF